MGDDRHVMNYVECSMPDDHVFRPRVRKQRLGLFRRLLLVVLP